MRRSKRERNQRPCEGRQTTRNVRTTPRKRKINKSVRGINHTKCRLIPKKRLAPMTRFRRMIVPTSSSPATSPHHIGKTTHEYSRRRSSSRAPGREFSDPVASATTIRETIGLSLSNRYGIHEVLE